MSFNHITNTIFDRLNEKEYVEGEDPRYYFSVLRDNPPNNWLEEEVDYVIDKMTRPEVIQTPYFFGLSALMDQFEQNSVKRLFAELSNSEKHELRQVANSLFDSWTDTHNKDDAVPRRSEFTAHWVVNLYLRRYALRNCHLTKDACASEHAWEHYAIISEALKCGCKPFRNVGQKFKLYTSPSNQEDIEYTTTELESENGKNSVTALILALDDGLDAKDYDTLNQTTPHIEWRELTNTKLPYRVLAWNFTTSQEYSTTLELPLTLFSGNRILMAPGQTSDEEEHPLQVLIVGNNGRMKRTYSAKEIVQQPTK